MQPYFVLHKTQLLLRITSLRYYYVALVSEMLSKRITVSRYRNRSRELIARLLLGRWLAALPCVLLAALLLALAGRTGQFHAAGVDRQCCGGVLPLIYASVAWRHVLCCGSSPDSGDSGAQLVVPGELGGLMSEMDGMAEASPLGSLGWRGVWQYDDAEVASPSRACAAHVYGHTPCELTTLRVWPTSTIAGGRAAGDS